MVTNALETSLNLMSELNFEKLHSQLPQGQDKPKTPKDRRDPIEDALVTKVDPFALLSRKQFLVMCAKKNSNKRWKEKTTKPRKIVVF